LELEAKVLKMNLGNALKIQHFHSRTG